MSYHVMNEREQELASIIHNAFQQREKNFIQHDVYVKHLETENAQLRQYKERVVRILLKSNIHPLLLSDSPNNSEGLDLLILYHGIGIIDRDDIDLLLIDMEKKDNIVGIQMIEDWLKSI